MKDTAVKLFEDKKVRSAWDAENEKWYISVIDVIEVLTDSIDPRKYWNKLKQRLKSIEVNLELVLNMLAETATTEISKEQKPRTVSQNRRVAAAGASAAFDARKNIEAQTGKKVVTRLNAGSLKVLK